MPSCPNCGRPLSDGHEICLDCRENGSGETAWPEQLASRTGLDPTQLRPDSSTDEGRLGGSSVGSRDDLELCGGDGDRVAIARFQNGAEVGFFADELARQTGLETEVLAREKFDAVHAVWSVDYLLLVDRAEAERAAHILQALVESTGDEGGDEVESRTPASEIPGGVLVPLILTLAAGSIACFGIERIDHRPRPPALVVGDARKPPELWELLKSARGRWVQRLENGTATRELSVDAEQGIAVLREDRDGDGRFEQERRFSLRRR